MHVMMNTVKMAGRTYEYYCHLNSVFKSLFIEGLEKWVCCCVGEDQRIQKWEGLFASWH